jgi:hypothetical protein
MRIVLITQNDPFYLHNNINHLIKIMPTHSSIVGCVLSNPSPFGRQEGFLKKSYRTFKIFRITFFLYYSFKFILNKVIYKKDVFKALKKHSIPKINIDNSINSKNSLNEIKKYEPDLLISILGKQFVFSGGSYFRVLPYYLIKRFTKKSDYKMAYFHPRDFDSDQLMISDLPYIRKFKSYVGLKNCKNILTKWLREYNFTDIKSAEKNDWDHIRNIVL